jgi:hypothetical protein
MAGKPFDWNVVVVGSWNPAILMPKGVARRLLQLPDGAPLEVQISMDQPAAPFRVKHGGLIVTPDIDRLHVQPVVSTLDGLLEAARVADRALESLPETPVTAAGVNVRYGFDEAPDELIALLESGLCDELAGVDMQPAGRAGKHGLHWRDGVLNIEVQLEDDSSATLVFNFHKQSTAVDQLRAWLGRVAEMVPLAVHLATEKLHVALEEEEPA